MSTIIGIREALDALPSTKKLLVWKDSFQYHFQIVDAEDKIASKRKHSPHKGIFVTDTQTGIVYISRSECARQLAHLVNKKPEDSGVYSRLKWRFYGRFVEIKKKG